MWIIHPWITGELGRTLFPVETSYKNNMKIKITHIIVGDELYGNEYHLRMLA